MIGLTETAQFASKYYDLLEFYRGRLVLRRPLSFVNYKEMYTMSSFDLQTATDEDINKEATKPWHTMDRVVRLACIAAARSQSAVLPRRYDPALDETEYANKWRSIPQDSTLHRRMERVLVTEHVGYGDIRDWMSCHTKNCYCDESFVGAFGVTKQRFREIANLVVLKYSPNGCDIEYMTMPPDWFVEGMNPHINLNGDGVLRVAYYENFRNLMERRYTFQVYGRFVQRFMTMADKELMAHVESMRGELANTQAYKLAITADEIKTLYLGGPNSCMSYESVMHTASGVNGGKNIHPCSIYAYPFDRTELDSPGSNHIAIAYLGDIAQARARCLVYINGNDKRYGRHYGGNNLLVRALEADGFREDLTILEGVKVSRIVTKSGRLLAPYCDGVDGYDDHLGDGTEMESLKGWLVCTDESPEMERETSGYTRQVQARQTCAHCRERFRPDDGRFLDVSESWVCDECIRKHYVYGTARIDAYGRVHNDYIKKEDCVSVIYTYDGPERVPHTTYFYNELMHRGLIPNASVCPECDELVQDELLRVHEADDLHGEYLMCSKCHELHNARVHGVEQCTVSGKWVPAGTLTRIYASEDRVCEEVLKASYSFVIVNEPHFDDPDYRWRDWAPTRETTQVQGMLLPIYAGSIWNFSNIECVQRARLGTPAKYVWNPSSYRIQRPTHPIWKEILEESVLQAHINRQVR